MTYTAEWLREMATTLDSNGCQKLAEQHRAHADALEENARLRAERDTHVAVTERIKVALRIRGTGSYVEWAAHCRDALDKLERAEAELAKLRRGLESAMDALGILASMSPKRYDGEQFRKMAAEDYRRIRADFPEEK